MQNKSDDLITALLTKHLEPNPRAVAIVDQDVDCTYQQLADLVFMLGTYLRTQGVKPADRVLIEFPNSIEYIAAFLATVSVGAIAVPIDYQVGPERIKFTANATQSRFILSKNKYEDHFFASTSATLEIDLKNNSFLVGPNRLGITSALSSTMPLSAESTAAIIFSSGSTGRPKGVILKHRHLCVTAKNLALLVEMTPSHRELLLSPACHTDGWQRIAATLFSGGCVYIYDGPLTVPHFADFVSEKKITGFYSPPPFVRFILQSSSNHAKKIADSCRSIEIGSAPVSPAELQSLMTLFPTTKFYVHFGLTESSRATALDCRNHLDKLHTVGQALPGVELKIVKTHGQETTDLSGEIYLRGQQCTEGYWQDLERSKSAFDEGWFKTGDYGQLDAEGFLTYLGRHDDMINFGGYHFFPNEVETELGPVPGLQTYIIAAKPDPAKIMEQIPILYGIKSNEVRWSTEDFYRFAKQRLAPFKVPRQVILVESILRTPSGKPDRRALFEKYKNN